MRNNPIIVTGEGYGLRSLLALNYATTSGLRPFLQQVMRASGPLPVVVRELIASFVAHSLGSQYCFDVHTAVSVRFLTDSKDPNEQSKAFMEYTDRHDVMALLNFVEAALKRRVTPEVLEHAREHWGDAGVHDATLIVSAYTMVSSYVETLVAPEVNPLENEEDVAEINAVAQRLFEKGYV